MTTAMSQEDKVFYKLEEAWALFCDLPETQSNDLSEFRTAVRHAQHMVVLRTTRAALKRCTDHAAEASHFPRRID